MRCATAWYVAQMLHLLAQSDSYEISRTMGKVAAACLVVVIVVVVGRRLMQRK